MRIFTVHDRPESAEPLMIKEGFSWPAFFFSFLWALWHRLWGVALGLLVVDLALRGLLAGSLDPLSGSAVSLGLALAVGYLANDLHRWRLAGKGRGLIGVVVGSNYESALHRWLVHNRGM